MRKNILILFIFIGMVQLGYAQISYYKSINSDFKDAYNMIISPDNRFCYVATFNNFQVYERNKTTGELMLISSIEQTNDGTFIYYPYTMAISADSNFLYLGFREYYCVFKVDVASGLLTPVQTVQNWESPGYIMHTANCLVLSKDERYLYSAVRDDVFLYSRDSITGQLTLIEEYEDVNYVPGLSYEVSCTLSPDNRFLYVTGGNGITSFIRDAATGLLTLKQDIRGSNYQNESLTYARESMVSFDNRFLYTVSNSMGSGAAVVLAVDPITDSLSILQSHAFIFSNYNLTNPNSMTLSPNHKAFVVSSSEEAAFFEIDTISGHIELINTFFSRSGYSPDMGGRKVYDKGNQYLYSNPVYEDSIYIYRANVFFNDHVSFCEGGSAELTPFADYQSYLWSTGSTASSIVVTDSGQYVLHVIDKFNNSFTDTVFVAINPLPAVSLGHDTTLQFGEYIALSPGYGYAHWQWNIDNWTGPIYYFTNDSTITVDSIQIAVTVTDVHGCTNADTILIYLNPPAGLTETQSNIHSFIISPNPASSMVSISSSLGSGADIRAEIYSIQGALILTERIKNNSKMDVSSLNSGMYLLKLNYPNGSYTSRLIITK